MIMYLVVNEKIEHRETSREYERESRIFWTLKLKKKGENL